MTSKIIVVDDVQHVVRKTATATKVVPVETPLTRVRKVIKETAVTAQAPSTRVQVVKKETKVQVSQTVSRVQRIGVGPKGNDGDSASQVALEGLI